MALMAGAGLLPMLGSALSGLLGGGGSGGAAGSPQAGAAGQSGGMTPETERALAALDMLAEVYGDGPTDDPKVQQLRDELGVSGGSSDGTSGGSSGDTSGGSVGSGETATMVKARQLYQANAAIAFNNLDNQLANYITGMAGSNRVDKQAVRSLIREVNAALNAALSELGVQAYTKEGHQQVRKILTAALKKAQTIVAGGQAKAGDTATAIDRLTNQYLYNIAGTDVSAGYNGASTDSGASTKAQRMVEAALKQRGKPYVWGAEGPNGFDCSGLVYYAARQAGVNIDRTTAAGYYNKLPRVSSLKPGDLIFPKDSFPGKNFANGQPGHVMIYIGNGQCVHAPGRGKYVTTTSLPSQYQAARMTG